MTTEVIFNLLKATVLIAVIFGAIFLFLKKAEKSEGADGVVKKASSEDGVEKTLSKLKSYARHHGFTYISPAAFAVGDKKCSLDAIIVTYNGVVGIKCEGRNGQVFSNPHNEPWLWVAGSKRENFTSPSADRSVDTRTLREVLTAAKLRTTKVECFTVFTSKNVVLSVPSGEPIMPPNTLMNMLAKEIYLSDNGLDKDAVAAAINNAIN